MLLSEKVVKISGSSQFIVPLVQLRACLDMPDMLASGLDEVTSSRCWLMRVRKETRVWPMYFALSLQLQLSWYTPFWSILLGRVLFGPQRRLPNFGPGLEWKSTLFERKARLSCLLMEGT